MVKKTGSQFFKSRHMGIQSSSADLISTRLGNESFFETGEQRTGKHNCPAQPPAFLSIGFAVQVININLIRLKTAFVSGTTFCSYAHFLQEFYKQVDVQNIRNI